MSSTRTKIFQNGFDGFNRRATLCSTITAEPVRQMAVSCRDDGLLEPGYKLLIRSDRASLGCLNDRAEEHAEAKSKYIANIFIDGRID